MDTKRLAAAIDHILAGYDQTQILKRLQALQQASANLLSAPGNQDHLTQFKTALAKAQESIAELQSRRLPAGTESALRSVGAGTLLPEDLRAALDRIVSAAGPSLSTVNTELSQLSAQVANTVTLLQSARAALQQLQIKPHVVPAGLCEVGVFVPEDVTNDDLDTVREQLDEWSKVFKTSLEIANAKVSPIRMTGAESDSFDFHVVLDMEGAKALLLLVGGVVTMFGLANKYRKKREELEREKFPDAVTRALKEAEDGVRKQEVEKTVDVVIKNANQAIDGGRINELRVQVKTCIEFVADSMSRGVRVEVLPPPARDGGTPTTGSEIEGKRADFASLVSRLETGIRRIERGESGVPELTAAPDVPSEPKKEPE